MLPSPCFLTLIFIKGIGWTHEQTGCTRGAQSGIHFIQNTRGCAGRENMNDALC
ncbi:Uncharacterised protein [Vibrio cholerae]|uniref:Uncharacterized protein n=1 Tax=Vibrio cholerae TaxID=666 RepID=A0A655W402_VIBCL|nr:Uncharacterised protein [Vibrio cholerae]CSB80738.1 Uncharacterised protein [Vibrio cholerae]